MALVNVINMVRTLTAWKTTFKSFIPDILLSVTNRSFWTTPRYSPILFSLKLLLSVYRNSKMVSFLGCTVSYGSSFSQIPADLEWKVTYVGSAHDSQQDQVLDEVLVGPVPVGLNKFVLQADAPNVEKIPTEEVLGVTVVLVSCSYKEREFVQVGFYVNNEYIPEESAVALAGDPAAAVERPFEMSLLHKVQRQILADKPRVTKFPICWTDSDKVSPEGEEVTVNTGEDNLLEEKMQGTPETVDSSQMMEME